MFKKIFIYNNLILTFFDIYVKRYIINIICELIKYVRNTRKSCF